ncbi:MAG: hypothetical protein AAGJ50_01925, partial [Pseudomonadota bacterium]
MHMRFTGASALFILIAIIGWMFLRETGRANDMRRDLALEVLGPVKVAGQYQITYKCPGDPPPEKPKPMTAGRMIAVSASASF